MKLRTLLASLCVFTLAFPLAAAATTPKKVNTSVDRSVCSTWLRFIDISVWNPNIVWNDVAKAGVYGAYVKLTQSNDYVNPDAAAQTKGANGVGLPVGYYDFATPGKDTFQADARYFVAHGGGKGELPPVLDLEKTWTTTPLTVKWAVGWLRTVKALTHRQPVLYSGGEYSWSGAKALVNAAPLWVAAYPLGEGVTPPGGSACSLTQPKVGGWSGWSAWQYTDAGNIYGAPSHVDVDVATPAFWKWANTGVVITIPKSATNRFPAGVWTTGSKGPRVVLIQKFLAGRKVYHGKIDGLFGPLTRAAVIAWQRYLHIQTDGQWGPATEKATNKWLAKHPSVKA